VDKIVYGRHGISLARSITVSNFVSQRMKRTEQKLLPQDHQISVGSEMLTLPKPEGKS
jgi:hypothetical protein